MSSMINSVATDAATVVQCFSSTASWLQGVVFLGVGELIKGKAERIVSTEVVSPISSSLVVSVVKERVGEVMQPLLNIGLVTLGANYLFRSVHSGIFQGAIFGFHLFAVDALTNQDSTRQSSLKKAAVKWLISSSQYVDLPSWLVRPSLNQEKAEKTAVVTGAVARIGFTVLLQNPILGSAVGYSVEALAHAVAMRSLRVPA